MNKGKSFLSELKLYTDYLKWKDGANRYETWEEAYDEIFEQHLNKYGEKIQYLVNYVKPFVYDKAILASQRNLQFRGDKIFNHNSRLYNCSVAYCYSPDIFKKGFYMLLSGSGFGVSLKNKFTKNLPKIDLPNSEAITYQVPDSIEGWCESIHVLISSYCKHKSLYKEYYGKKIKFDYSLIREKGAYITGGFKAPGHEGLKKSLEKIETVLNDNIGVFRPYVVYNILMHISDAVLSGGVRRSAMNIIFDYEDKEMLHAKTGNWRQDNPHFARSNNSVGLVKGTFSKETFFEILNLNVGDNDVGFVLQSDDDQLLNPCVSADSLVNTPQGLYLPTSLTDSNGEITLSSNVFKRSAFKHTGFQPILEIETVFGRKIKVTGNHIMFTNSGMLTADSLKKGDRLLISNNSQSNINIDNNSKDYKIGYLLGSLLGDGNFSRNSCQIKFWGEGSANYHNICNKFIEDLGWGYKKPVYKKTDSKSYTVINNKKLYEFIQQKDSSVIENKRLTKKLLEGSFNYLSGIVSGYFDADGTVLFNSEKGSSLRISSNQLENLENIQIALNSLGVYSKIYKNRNKVLNGVSTLPDGKGSSKEYKVKNSHELVISRKSIDYFNKNVLIINTKKKEKINYIVDVTNFYSHKFEEEILSITQLLSENVYDCTVEEGIEAFDCNGFVVHNCYEISFSYYNKIQDYSDTVIQMCNLCEINASWCKDKKGKLLEDTFYNQCRAAAIMGTLQAGYTNFPYLGNQTEDIVRGEALLGVSITGWMDNPELFNSEVLKKGAEVVKETNKEVAKLIGINPAARTTCVKPSGNASVILQTPSGIHSDHSKRYFRVMQINKESEVAKWLLSNYPEMLEESKWSQTNSDYVVFVPVENSSNAIFKDSIKDIEHIKMIQLVQENWVKEGTNTDSCYTKNHYHNVSNTILLDNKEDIVDYIYDNMNDFTAVSFLDRSGDKDYTQAPFTSVLDENELLEKYGKGAILASGLVIDGLHAFNGDLWQACDSLFQDRVEGFNRQMLLLQQDWIRRGKKFAKNYFKRDIKQAIYCLKDVHLFHKWQIINQVFKTVPDFKSILSKPQFTDIDTLGAIACSGGSCEIT